MSKRTTKPLLLSPAEEADLEKVIEKAFRDFLDDFSEALNAIKAKAAEAKAAEAKAAEAKAKAEAKAAEAKAKAEAAEAKAKAEAKAAEAKADTNLPVPPPENRPSANDPVTRAAAECSAMLADMQHGLTELFDKNDRALRGVFEAVETARSPATFEAVHAAHGRPLEIDRRPPSRFPNFKAVRPSSAGRVTGPRGRRIKVGYTG